MDINVGRLLQRIADLENEIEQAIDDRRKSFHYHFERRRVRFEREMVVAHRRLRKGIGRFLRQSGLPGVLASPLVYVLFLPLAMLDLLTTLFVVLGFPVYGIAKVRRADFVVLDRHHLAYLNGIEKLNCIYCGYANGVIAFTREVASRAEEHWCPIKHARRTRDPHRRYYAFVDYGDAEEYRKRRPDDGLL